MTVRSRSYLESKLVPGQPGARVDGQVFRDFLDSAASVYRVRC